jgi:DNA-binding response OmpR family regulator
MMKIHQSNTTIRAIDGRSGFDGPHRTPRVLVADDDQIFRELMTDWLEHNDFEVVTVKDGSECHRRLLTEKFDVLILDWRMPGLTGLELCRWLRSRGDNTPVILLSAKDNVEDKEIGLAAGADDYLTKPFQVRELTMRVNALIRRARGAYVRVLEVGPLTMDPHTQTATLDGASMDLTGTEFAVLEYMARHPGKVFGPQALLDGVWKHSSTVSIVTVRVYLKRLKQKLEMAGHNELIQNVHGVGYKVQAPAPSLHLSPKQAVAHFAQVSHTVKF